ncbi:VOC family protein [Streptomyces sp. NPDC102340]|uniref:VOC family protein n=1 Tax=unclassified Streptomyces TaxID=2593676 RepID=UPI00380517DB
METEPEGAVPALKASDLYHTGIVVPDVEAAMARMSEAAGYRWTRVEARDTQVRLANGTDRVLALSYTYSLDAPHIELVQEIPGTPWTATARTAAHHLGYFCDDIPATSKRLEDAGFALEVCGVVDGNAPSVFAYHLAPTGVRIEIVDRAVLPDWPAVLQSRM